MNVYLPEGLVLGRSRRIRTFGKVYNYACSHGESP